MVVEFVLNLKHWTTCLPSSYLSTVHFLCLKDLLAKHSSLYISGLLCF